MATECRSLEELKRVLESAIDLSIAGDGSHTIDYIRFNEASNAAELVYKAYPDPVVYNDETGYRRYSLMEDENMPFSMVGGKLTITATAPFNQVPSTNNKGNGLPYLIEGGHQTNGYKYEYPKKSGSDENRSRRYPYFFPRPYIAATREYLETNKAELAHEMILDLRANGYSAEATK